MAPEQIRILPIGDDQAEYARGVADKCEKLGFRVTVDERNEKIGYKIRAAQLEKIPYMLVIGEKEMNDGAVAVRSRKNGDLGAKPVDEFLALAKEQVDSFSKDN
jgi:threonyl-tRNA synthetase